MFISVDHQCDYSVHIIIRAQVFPDNDLRFPDALHKRVRFCELSSSLVDPVTQRQRCFLRLIRSHDQGSRKYISKPCSHRKQEVFIHLDIAKQISMMNIRTVCWCLRSFVIWPAFSSIFLTKQSSSLSRSSLSSRLSVSSICLTSSWCSLWHTWSTITQHY